MNPRRFTVALSFPGEHREFVSRVADHLASTFGEERVLYDKYHDAEFARVDLDVYLPDLYRTQSELLVVFLCAEYAAKRWCNLEWRYIRQLIATLEAERIMLLTFGDPGDLSQLGVLPGDGYIDILSLTPETVAEKILKRLLLNQGNIPPPSSPRAGSSLSAQTSLASGALAVWQEKLDFLLMEEAKAVDPDQKFRLHKLIQEARMKIRERGGNA